MSNLEFNQHRKFNAIVHIGTEKTGTSSLQAFLHINREKLSEQGYHFIQSAGKKNNRAIPACCININKNGDDFFLERGAFTVEDRDLLRKVFIARLHEEIIKIPGHIHTIIISSEHFHSRLVEQEEVDRLKNLLDMYVHQYQIICYLRNQVECAVSAYSTHLKSGDSQALSEFVKNCNIQNQYYNYYAMLERWKRTFGFSALDVSVFDNKMFLNQDLLDDFVAKIDPVLTLITKKPKGLINESLNLNGQIISRAIYNAFPKFKPDRTVNHRRIALQDIVSEHLSGRGEQPALEDQQRIYDEFSPSNEMIRRQYFPHLSSLFIRPSSVKAAETASEEQLTKTIELLIAVMADKIK